MNNYARDLLQRAFLNYKNTGNRETEFRAKSLSEWFYYSEAFRYLHDEGYILANDDEDFDVDKVNATSSVWYELIEKGWTYVREN
jgi:hypothetical protein